MNPIPVFTVFDEIQEALTLPNVGSHVLEAVFVGSSIIFAFIDLFRVYFDVSHWISTEEVPNSSDSAVRHGLTWLFAPELLSSVKKGDHLRFWTSAASLFSQNFDYGFQEMQKLITKPAS